MPRQTCIGCQEWWGKCMCERGLCVRLSCLPAEQGRKEECIWGWFSCQWSNKILKGFLILCQALTTFAVICLHTWPSVYPNPLPFLFSPFTVSFPPTTLLFSSVIHLSIFLTPQLFCSFFHSLLTWFHLCFIFSSPLLLFILPSFVFQSFHRSLRERYRSELGKPGTNQSIDLSMYPSLYPSDRQQKTKCLLRETFPISFLPHPCLLHYPPSLGNGEAISATCPPSWDLVCLPITFL